jgi:hypothetical protein
MPTGSIKRDLYQQSIVEAFENGGTDIIYWMEKYYNRNETTEFVGNAYVTP